VNVLSRLMPVVDLRERDVDRGVRHQIPVFVNRALLDRHTVLEGGNPSSLDVDLLDEELRLAAGAVRPASESSSA
jgi:hypothetical protein